MPRNDDDYFTAIERNGAVADGYLEAARTARDEATHGHEAITSLATLSIAASLREIAEMVRFGMHQAMRAVNRKAERAVDEIERERNAAKAPISATDPQGSSSSTPTP